jgi:hypothetical protein
MVLPRDRDVRFDYAAIVLPNAGVLPGIDNLQALGTEPLFIEIMNFLRFVEIRGQKGLHVCHEFHGI